MKNKRNKHINHTSWIGVREYYVANYGHKKQNKASLKCMQIIFKYYDNISLKYSLYI